MRALLSFAVYAMKSTANLDYDYNLRNFKENIGIQWWKDKKGHQTSIN